MKKQNEANDIYINTLQSVLEKHGVKIRDRQSGYVFLTEGNIEVGRVDAKGNFKMGGMDFNINDTVAWERWKATSFPNAKLADAIRAEFHQAIVSQGKKVVSSYLFQRGRALRAEENALKMTAEERRLGIGRC